MNITEAASLTRRLLNEHGYGHVPFEFSRAKKTLAAAHFNRYTDAIVKVTLSEHYARLLSEDEIRQTILHEIAHLNAGHAAGHGPVWKAHAIALGIPAKRCVTPSAEPAAAWEGTCPKGHTVGAHRAPQRVKACGKCSRTWRFENVYTWKHNGRAVGIGHMPNKYRMEYLNMQRMFS